MPPRRSSAAVLLAALLLFAGGSALAQGRSPEENYARALRLRAALDATPRANRTAGQYTQALNAFRAVYHADRADPHAAASVEAAAELLAEEGRVLHNPGLLRAAVEQLAFLRRNFGASPFAIPALLTQGEIEARDLHDDTAAGAQFAQFLASYPQSPLAPQARAELQRLGVSAPEPPSRAVAQQSAFAAAPAREQQAQSEPGAEATVPTPTFRTWAPSSALGTSETRNGPTNERTPTSVIHGVAVFRRAGRASAEENDRALVTGIRHWSTGSYTRIAIDVASKDGEEPPFEASRVADPDRIFFDLHGARLAPELAGKAVSVTDGGFLERIRAAQFSGDVVRVVLDVSDVSDYSAFWLPNPSRLIIDIHGRAKGAPPPVFANAPGSRQSAAAIASANPAPHTPAARDAAAGKPTPHAARLAAPGVFVADSAPSSSPVAPPGQGSQSGDSVAAIAALSRQPSRVRATEAPTTAPVSAVTARPKQASPKEELAGEPPTPPASRKRKRHAAAPETTLAEAARPAEPDATGGRSMVRALGLKINRIVIDAGHGGHDSGTLGPGGIEEKNIVLDVALRLGKLLKQRLGADVIYTRDDDTFIPLETRTAIANKAQADLFISIHANSSPNPSARGVETYYLNFTTSADALEVAARENAVSDESIHQLSDLVKKITLQDKIAESREFATDVEGSLYGGLETGNSGLKNRGVKKAPFVVLIGANMPSILAEISFLTNPDDATELRDPAYRERIAESLYGGVARYVRSLSGAQLEETAGTR